MCEMWCLTEMGEMRGMGTFGIGSLTDLTDSC